MIKKLIIAALIIWGLYMFYQYFMADTLEPFFQEGERNTDFIGSETTGEKFDRALEKY